MQEKKQILFQSLIDYSLEPKQNTPLFAGSNEVCDNIIW